MNIDKIKNVIKTCNLTSLVLWLLVAVGIILRIKVYSFNTSFWLDECSLGVNINNIGSDYLKYFKPLDMNQCAPPLFMITCRMLLDISHQAGHFYNQDLMLRLFPFLCSVASLPLFANLLTKISTNRYFLWTAMAMLAFNKTAIYYSQEFKQYSCEMMFALILINIFYSINLKDISIKKLSLYVLVFALSMWFSSSAILILFVGYLLLAYEVIKNKIFNKAKLAILLAPIITNITIYYFVYYRPVNKALHSFMLNFWANKAHSFFTFSNFSEMFTQKIQKLIYFPCSELLILFLIISLIIFIINKEFNYKTKFLVTSSIVLIVIASFLNVYPFEQRLILFLLPMFIIVYSQFSFLIKENLTSTMSALLIFIFLTNIGFTISRRNLIKQNINNKSFRKYAQFIIDNKIPPKKIIMTTPKQMDYYLHTYFSKEDYLFYDDMWKEFEKSKLPKIIKKLPEDDYWFFISYKTDTNYVAKSRKFFEKCKDLEIIEIIEEENNKKAFIIHFKKI